MRQTPIKLFLLDWDGVICDSLPVLFHLHRRQTGDSIVEVEQFRAHLAVLNERGENPLRGKLSHYTEEFLKCPLFPGMHAALSALRDSDAFVALVSTGPLELIAAHLKRHQLEDVFDHVFSSQSPWLKPDTRLLGLIGETFGCAESQTVFVGDQVSDVVFVRNTEFVKVFASYGFHPAKALRMSIDSYSVTQASLVASSEIMAKRLCALAGSDLAV